MGPRNQRRDGSAADSAPDDGTRVPDGWTATTWVAELRRKADRCGSTQPEQAERYRRTAAALQA